MLIAWKMVPWERKNIEWRISLGDTPPAITRIILRLEGACKCWPVIKYKKKISAKNIYVYIMKYRVNRI